MKFVHWEFGGNGLRQSWQLGSPNARVRRAYDEPKTALIVTREDSRLTVVLANNYDLISLKGGCIHLYPVSFLPSSTYFLLISSKSLSVSP